MICSKCGASNIDTAKNCASCGAAIAPVDAGAAGGAAHGPGIPEFAKSVITPGLIARVKNIILTPASEWLVIDAEMTSAREIYLHYVAPLAAIGAIAGFIGRSLIGINVGFFGTFRTPIVSGLASALVFYALTFVGVFIVALIVDALAPTFGGHKDSLRALKVAAYSNTPGWIAGILQILPSLGILALIALLYGIYLFYLGLPVLMRCAKDKAVVYTAVVFVCTAIVYIVIGTLSTRLVAGFMPGSSFAPGTTLSDSGGGLFASKSDADRARVAAAMQTLAAAGQQAAANTQATTDQQAAQSSGGAADSSQPKPADPAAAMAALGTMMTGGAKIKPVDFHALKDMLPESLPGLKRDDASGQTAQAMGFAAASATGRYSDGAGKSVTVEITDLGTMSALAGMASKFDPNFDRESDSGYERTAHVNGELVHEQYDNRSKNGEAEVIAGNRFAVSVKGNGVDMDLLTSTLQQIDVSKLASLAAAN